MKLKNLFLCAVVFAAAGCSDSNEPNNNQPKEYVPLSLPASQSRVSEQANDFSISLFDATLQQKKDDNVLISPLSANIALSMIANATAGDTHKELTEVLGFANDIAALNDYSENLLSYLPSVDNTAELYMPNSFWHTLSSLKPDFKEKMVSEYNAEVNFNSDCIAPIAVNNWVAKKTNGHITKIVKDEDFLLFAFINSMYFKAIWKVPFNEAKTKRTDFHNANGNVTKTNMMNATIMVEKCSGANYSSISLPYGNGAFNFDIVLPNQGVSTEDVAATLKQDGMPQYNSRNEVELSLPKFTLENIFDLVPVMEDLGVKALFSKDCDLSGMSDDSPLYIDILNQANKIVMDEKGTTIASATIGGMILSAPESTATKFVVDRPFIFFVREQSTNAILLAGRINKL